MPSQNNVNYTRRDKVVKLLFSVMKSVLTRRDFCILTAYCGYTAGHPLCLAELAERFALGSSADAKKALEQAISTVRHALPASQIALYVRGFHPSDPSLK